MTQTWNDLLFAHWAVDPGELRSRIPGDFELDLYDGKAWIGIVPFYMTNVSARGVPSLPWISEFPELNVRTYVSVADRPGVYFFSLDAGSALAVRTARALLNLPYFSAIMQVSTHGDTVAYDSRRNGGRHRAEFAATYEPSGRAAAPTPGTLEYFLTERYCLYNRNHRKVPYRLEIHHLPWPLQRAEARLARNELAAANGLSLPSAPPLLHFSKRQDVVAWAPTSI